MPSRLSAAGTSIGSGRATEVESQASWPQMTCMSSAQSRTVSANGPIWSSDEAKAISP